MQNEESAAPNPQDPPPKSELHGGEGESAIPEDSKVGSRACVWGMKDVESKAIGRSVRKRRRQLGTRLKEPAKLVVLEEMADDEHCEHPVKILLRASLTAFDQVSFYTFVSPLASSMMAPGLPEVAEKYNITSETIVAMTLSIFLLTFAIGPLFLAPLSEMYGRTWVSLSVV